MAKGRLSIYKCPAEIYSEEPRIWELSSRGIPTAIVDEILNLDPRIFNPKNLRGFLHLEGFKSSDQTSSLSIAKSGDKHSIRDYKSLKNIKV